jgi:hypothetical protein
MARPRLAGWPLPVLPRPRPAGPAHPGTDAGRAKAKGRLESPSSLGRPLSDSEPRRPSGLRSLEAAPGVAHSGSSSGFLSRSHGPYAGKGCSLRENDPKKPVGPGTRLSRTEKKQGKWRPTGERNRYKSRSTNSEGKWRPTGERASSASTRARRPSNPAARAAATAGSRTSLASCKPRRAGAARKRRMARVPDVQASLHGGDADGAG